MTEGDDIRPVVLLHSIGTDRGLWRDQVEAIGSTRTVLTYDSPGHGGREEISAISVQQWVDDLDAFVAQVQGPFHLVGLSMGGVQAMAYAAARPERIASLVIADAFARLDADVAAAKIEGIEQAVATADMTAYAQDYLDQTFVTERAEERRDDLAAAIARVSPGSYVASARACFHADVLESLERVGAPTLVLIGERDEKTPRALSQEVAEAIEGARLVVVPAAGHLSNIDAPEEFTHVLAEHLDAVDSRPRSSHSEMSHDLV